jgi:purine-binding chemotaxis protein CheW
LNVGAEPASCGVRRQLMVAVGGQRFALAGDAVREVLRRPHLTRVPHGPPALLGVCNLRGSVLPVVSLARLMGEEAGSEARVIVLDHKGLVGLLADAVLAFDVEDDAADDRRLDLLALLEAGFQRPAVRPSVPRATVDTRPDEAGAPEVGRVLVSFFVQGQTFALPLAAVTEVLRLPDQIARVTHADPAVLGMVDVRDRSLPIVSLAVLLGFAERRADRPGDPILVVDRDGAQIGLVADAIDTILRLPEAAIDKVPTILQRGRGEARLDAIGRPGAGRALVSILSVQTLFADAPIQPALASHGRTAMIEEVARREQFVAFDLGGERYGLPIAAVDEVLRLPEQITRLPNAPRFVIGIINLRGRPVPIIDQRHRFDAPTAGGSARPRVIIVSFGSLQAGFVVDGVTAILSVASTELAAAPPLSSDRAALFDRVATGEDGSLILLIDPRELLNRAEQDVVADIAARQTAAASP